jgi:D-3-phosphoglycerate dehydrogenase
MLSRSLKGENASSQQASNSQDIPVRPSKKVSISESWNQNMGSIPPNGLSTSPTLTFHSPPAGNSFGGGAPLSRVKSLKPFATQDIKVLLLENINLTGQDLLREQGYQVETYKSSLGEEELIEKIKDVHVIGIRSKTKLTAKVLNAAKSLLVIGCFCIGTNQVDLTTAASLGVAVFNSPFSNSRSVAELTLAEIIALARQLTDRSSELHNGTWNKVSAGCWEVRGKTLGIVGYGHIGSQLSVLSESLGLRVIYHDIVALMALGTARQVRSLDELLEQADFVSLHVPELPETKGMIGPKQIARMRDGAYLINNARGSLVDVPALVDALRSGKLAGAAIDVYPSEPGSNGDYFTSSTLSKGEKVASWVDDLRSVKNVIMTPHIGGSTEEAQRAIGVEVATALIKYVNDGSTVGAVNLPEVSLRSLSVDDEDHARVIFIHKNVPGVLRLVNEILADHNVEKQMTDSRGEVAYLMADVSSVNAGEIKELWSSLEGLGGKCFAI